MLNAPRRAAASALLVLTVIILDSPVSAQPSISTPGERSMTRAADLAKFVGKYEHAPQSWDVALRDGKLYVTTDGKEHELKPAGANQFSYPGGGMLFVANASGEFEHIFMGLYAARRTNR